MSLVLLCSTLSHVVPAPPRQLQPLKGDSLALGFDFGTSGVRCAVINAEGELIASPTGYSWGERERCQEAADWKLALDAQMEALPVETRARIRRIATHTCNRNQDGMHRCDLPRSSESEVLILHL